jgi:hypothetical protein
MREVLPSPHQRSVYPFSSFMTGDHPRARWRDYEVSRRQMWGEKQRGRVDVRQFLRALPFHGEDHGRAHRDSLSVLARKYNTSVPMALTHPGSRRRPTRPRPRTGSRRAAPSGPASGNTNTNAWIPVHRGPPWLHGGRHRPGQRHLQPRLHPGGPAALQPGRRRRRSGSVHAGAAGPRERSRAGDGSERAGHRGRRPGEQPHPRRGPRRGLPHRRLVLEQPQPQLLRGRGQLRRRFRTRSCPGRCATAGSHRPG